MEKGLSAFYLQYLYVDRSRHFTLRACDDTCRDYLGIYVINSDNVPAFATLMSVFPPG